MNEDLLVILIAEIIYMLVVVISSVYSCAQEEEEDAGFNTELDIYLFSSARESFLTKLN